VKRTSGAYLIIALIASDLAALLLAVLSSYFVRFELGWLEYEEFQPLRDYVGLAMLLLLFAPPVFASNDLYQPKRRGSRLDELYAVFTAVSITTVLAMVASTFLWREFGPSRLVIAFSWFSAIPLVLIGRILVEAVQRSLRLTGRGEDRVLIVGDGEPARIILQHIRRAPSLGYKPVGCLVELASGNHHAQLPVLGTIQDLGTVIRQHQISDVIVAMPSLSHAQLVEIVGLCQGEQVNIRVYPDLFQIMTAGVTINELGGLPLLTVKDVALKGWNVVLKRAIDLLVGGVALVMLSPLLLVIAAMIKATSRGPVLYCQERVGLDGKPFQVIKFRSMRIDAEEESGPVWARPEDPRTTRIGAMLRRYSLDELPQFVNVILGEMSLVGPRPERPYFVEQFQQTIPRYWERHREKAGLTGWAQVNGLRGNTPIEDRTAYDIWYVENWSVWLDIKIMLKTLVVIFNDRNAY
jgi:exopolysaccharide biosynthesis polyprenyl glycosylphosphotransferase